MSGLTGIWVKFLTALETLAAAVEAMTTMQTCQNVFWVRGKSKYIWMAMEEIHSNGIAILARPS